MNSKNSHILNSASNLLGFSLIVITTIHAMNMGADDLIDDFAGLQILLFAISTVISFLSIRSKNEVYARRLEIAADAAFLLGLLVLVIVVGFFIINFS